MLALLGLCLSFCASVTSAAPSPGVNEGDEPCLRCDGAEVPLLLRPTVGTARAHGRVLFFQPAASGKKLFPLFSNQTRDVSHITYETLGLRVPGRMPTGCDAFLADISQRPRTSPNVFYCLIHGTYMLMFTGG